MNILAIGNSFSQDATARLMDLAGQAGRPLAVCNLYIGGCSLEQHLCNASLNRMGYDLQENGQSTGQHRLHKRSPLFEKVGLDYDAAGQPFQRFL